MNTTLAPQLFDEGKTKKLYVSGTHVLDVESKDDLTARNGKKHDILEGKGVLATETTCNVFELLRHHSLPVAYMGRKSERVFRTRRCDMIPLEVVVRLVVAQGSSYTARHPEVPVGKKFSPPEVEFYLKTKGKKWTNSLGREFSLPVDDLYLVWIEKKGKFLAYDPAKPVEMQEPVLEVMLEDLKLTFEDLDCIKGCALEVTGVLDNAWRVCANGQLKDIKIEFGWYTIGKFERPRLLIADVIDNDSWRLGIDGEEVSKEPYRQDAPLPVVLRNYQKVAALSKKFLEGIK